MKRNHLNKDKLIYTITFHIDSDNKLESYTYQTEVSAFGFLDDNHFERRDFSPDDDYIDKDYVLGIMTEPEYEY